MKRIALLLALSLALVIGGVAVVALVVVLLLRRLRGDLRQRVSRLPGRVMAKVMEHMPDE